MQELNEVMMFRVDKEFKGIMAKLKANHYNISSIARSAVYEKMKRILDSINPLIDENIKNK